MDISHEIEILLQFHPSRKQCPTKENEIITDLYRWVDLDDGTTVCCWQGFYGKKEPNQTRYWVHDKKGNRLYQIDKIKPTDIIFQSGQWENTIMDTYNSLVKKLISLTSL